MLQIHPNARTTPVTRAEIACSHERTGVLAQRYTAILTRNTIVAKSQANLLRYQIDVAGGFFSAGF